MLLEKTERIILNFQFGTLEEANEEIASVLSNPKYENKSINYTINYSKQGSNNPDGPEEYEAVSLDITIE